MATSKPQLFRYDDPLSAIPSSIQPSGRGELVPVVLRYDAPRHFAKGGLAAKAASVKSAGRMGDDQIVHVNQDELRQMEEMWGEPTTNPETGQPEFFLGFLKKLLPIALSFIPGVGPAIGGALGLSGTAGSAIGGALLGAGTSALQGGNPLTGAAQGAVGGAQQPSAPKTAANLTNNATPKVGTAAGTPQAQAAANVTPPSTAGNLSATGGQSSLQQQLPPAQGKPPNFWNKDFLGIKGLPNKFGIPLAGLAVYSMLKDGNGDDQSGGISSSMNADQLVGAKLQPTFGKGLPAPSGMYANLSARPQSSIAQSEMQAYGGKPEQRYFNYAKGGRTSLAVKGPGSGRSDDIPAMLSDGEYIVDADTVAMLGDGSSKAGADALDRLRVNIRKHKGRNMARGRMGAKAKPAEHYLRGGRV